MLRKINLMQTAEIINHIVNWLVDYSKKSGTKGFVIGVSGGIDSAVSSVLGAKTNLPILCAEMPIHQSLAQMQRASKHINWMKENWKNVKSVETDLTALFDTFIAQMPTTDNEEKTELALINTRARLRMTTLYYFAQLNNYLVLGTGNKVEDFGIGFFTKYGDGGVDISPIADLTKSEVFALGSKLGVIEEILTAPPTDGLWNDGRTDEDQIGATYPELEWAMDFKGDTTKLSERKKVVLEIYNGLRNANLHKMTGIPICNIPEDLK